MGIIINVLRRLGLRHLLKHDYLKAESYFRKIYDKKPERRENWYYLAMALMGQKRYEEAEKLFLAELREAGEGYFRFRTLGDMYYLWGKGEQAAAYYKKALELCDTPQEQKLFRERIKLCSSEKSFENVKMSHQAFEEGNSLISQGKEEKALEVFQRAVELDHTNFNAWNNIGTLYHINFSDSQKALEAFSQAAEYTSLPSITANMQQVIRSMEKQ